MIHLLNWRIAHDAIQNSSRISQDFLGFGLDQTVLVILGAKKKRGEKKKKKQINW